MAEEVALREVIHQEYVGVTESDTVAGTLSLLADEGVECAVVLRGGEAIGLVTPQDLYPVLTDEDLDGTPVTDVMRDPPPTLDPADTVAMAETLLVESGTPRVLVADDGDVVGLVDARDVLRVKTARQTETPPETQVSPQAAEQDSYSAQSVCEGCGSLAADLREFNGQLLCSDCRSV